MPDLDIEKISGSLQKIKEQATEQASKLKTQVEDKAPQPPSTIGADVDDYLLNSQAWHLNRETIKKEFSEVIMTRKLILKQF